MNAEEMYAVGLKKLERIEESGTDSECAVAYFAAAQTRSALDTQRALLDFVVRPTQLPIPEDAP